jgi:hypothetical protein
MNTIKIHNVETDEVIERERNAEELAQWEADKAEAETQEQARAELATKKAAAEAKLAALGLTADDLRALGL